MKTALIVSALCVATAVAVYAYPGVSSESTARYGEPSSNQAHVPQQRPLVEVVFVLDTTGSMGGLIQAAKDNIWSIARSMASAQPQPDIRIGLVAFRDRGDDYVTRVVALSDDLDSVYAQLMDLRADGGGDTPEAVNEALFDAVHTIQWSGDPNAYQAIFLVGDAQPQMHYQDDVKYPVTLQAAAARGIVVNTIQAGDSPATKAAWTEIAQLGRGAHFKVGQGGDAIAVATPFDAEMARLSQQLDQTRLYYGDEDAKERAESRLAATSKLQRGGSSGTLAQRAAFNASAAGARNFLGDDELVDDVAKGKVDLAEVDADSLPASLRDLDIDQRRQVIDETRSKRESLSEEIAALADQRQRYIETELKKDSASSQSLDHQIHAAVRSQAAKKGLVYGVPVH